jgi:uncharacterized protein (TIGR02271 family)
MTHTVVGLFDDRRKAQSAAQELVQKGFIRENIDVSNRRINSGGATTQVTVTEPTISDNISNFFNSLFGNDSKTARNYSSAAAGADAILSIQVDSMERARQAAEILDRHGAIDVDGGTTASSNQQISQQNFANTQPPQNLANSQGGLTIPIIEEQLQVGKQIVEQNNSLVRSRIVEKPVEAHLRLREEHIVVDRRPVDRAVTQADLASFKDEEIVLTERAEVPVIGKQARVVEEVVIAKNVSDRDEVIRDTVRRTDVEVEGFENTVNDNNDDLVTRKATN